MIYERDDTSNLLKYKSANPFKKFFLDRFLRNIEQLVEELSPTSVLEAGCGEGFVLRQISQTKGIKRLVGVDINSKVLKTAKKAVPSARYQKMDITNLKFPASSFDLVLALEILEHLKNPEDGLREVKKVTKKWAILSVPNEPWFSLLSFLSGRYILRLGRHPEHKQFWLQKTFLKFVNSYFKKAKLIPSFPWTVVLAEK
jgi:ubiquinone/menaquinone biosynthesis C-methylase UbiE